MKLSLTLKIETKVSNSNELLGDGQGDPSKAEKLNQHGWEISSHNTNEDVDQNEMT